MNVETILKAKGEEVQKFLSRDGIEIMQNKDVKDSEDSNKKKWLLGMCEIF